MGNYEKNSLIINDVCTKSQLEQYFLNPNDPTHVVNIVLDRIAKTFQDNPTLAFSSYETDDIFQLCWQWSIEVLVAGKYNCRTSLFGYLHTVCRNKIFKLKRDKQWRGEISMQKTCKTCKHRHTCTHKITYTDLDNDPKCKVIAKALARNQSKHALSVQADYDITEPEVGDTSTQSTDLNSTIDLYREKMPEKYKWVLEKILDGNIKGISKHTIIATRRWCWKILKQSDPDQYGTPRVSGLIKANYNTYQREDRRKRRKKNKQLGKPADGLPHKNSGRKTGRPVGRPRNNEIMFNTKK